MILFKSPNHYRSLGVQRVEMSTQQVRQGGFPIPARADFPPDLSKTHRPVRRVGETARRGPSGRVRRFRVPWDRGEGKPPMALVICDMSMSLDGYVTGPRDSRENPFGDGARMLHD
ncbi:hypothetical protein GCM10023322_51790 [Rugosimonospora acidiphila]|uniref:Uncharacterized protein n=1 Tax=Rugosimonospora acidiphila TaxID=556531 RepID=A0ABP9S973_9ACTN